ncbi:hypothetical protein CCB80_13110 [Armatimonadetes bacterium Uphvl-Ar1]|nr:hypothetical protein CCB80_13110 [Armatimonadetes bacterium Uphvl-Ar1]
MVTSHCRIDALTAVKANKAIVIRKGPRDHTQMLIWDFDTDVITPGQWMKADISPQCCDVTDDGQFVIISASDFSPLGDSRSKHNKSIGMPMWISVSRPPYFSALATWETYFHGTFTISSTNASMMHQIEWIIPDEVVDLADNARLLNFDRRFLRRGWGRVDRHSDSWDYTYLKICQIGQIWFERSNLTVNAHVKDHLGQIKLEIGPRPGGFNFIDIDNSGRLVYEDKGCLYAWRDFPNGKPQLIADLNPNKFENIPPPDWALGP